MSRRGVIVEAAVALTAGLAAGAALASPALAKALLPAFPVALAALVAWIAVVDVRTLTIPDGAVVALVLLALPLRAGTGALELALDLALSGGLLLAVRETFWRLRRLDALGLGDVKLGAAGGLLLGASGFAAALLAASLAGLVLAGVAALAGRTVRGEKLPFGALLAPAIVLALLLA